MKIVRPKVKERIAADFQALMLLARAVDLFLGEEVILKFVNSPLELCVDELRRAIMDECNLNLERQNMNAFRQWALDSTVLRRSGLADSVHVPEIYEQACSSRVLTMEFVEGPTLSEAYTSARKETGDWQDALTRALCVAALSIVDGPALFHADLHSGNLILMEDQSCASEQIAFIDFGCCGRLPSALKSCLFMQASAFAGKQPNVEQFTAGFAHALERIPGLGPNDLDTVGLARELKPLLKEFERLSPFGKNANPLGAELHGLLFHLQKLLCSYGVQLPREFTLLMKTACFGTLYFAMLDEAHREQLLSRLLQTGAAYMYCNPGESRHLLAPSTLTALMTLATSEKRRKVLIGAALPCAKRSASSDRATVLACASTCAAASLPLMIFAVRYFL